MASTEFELDKAMFLVRFQKLTQTLKRKRRKGVNYEIHTVGPFPFHKDRLFL